MTDWSHLDTLLACPACGAELDPAPPGRPLACRACDGRYAALRFGWDLVPPKVRLESPELWEAWDELQANGVVSYNMDAGSNLSVGRRDDCAAFREFCAFSGLVLDVGCGPQPWPSYFGEPDDGAAFVGIDPLAGERPADYPQLRAVGERLPFRDAAFDHLVFATSLDHAVDPLPPLREARRVTGPAGQVNVWIGEKDAGAPPPKSSPEWYRRLRVPGGAVDPFHLRRLEHAEVEALLDTAGLEVVEKRVLTVDDWRRHIFYRATPCTSSGDSSTA